jgi:type II secretory pathway pseudopilin PulG
MILNPYLHAKVRRSRQDGYVLLVMMLFFAVLAITLTAAAPSIAQSIRREREIELIHRGRQYARAIRLYYRKFGRYPTRLEELENTNNIRFLRKRYKDPMTSSGDWRLIHFGEAQLTMPSAGPPLPGATTAPGGASLGVASAGASSAFASTFSLSSQPAPGQSSAAPGATGATQPGSADSSQPSQSPSGLQSGQPGTAASQLSSSLGGRAFGGGPVVGVASTSKKESLKVLNTKDHYNEWEFVYDPRLDVTMAQAAPGAAGRNQTPGVQGPGIQPAPSSPGMPGIQPIRPQ